MSRMMIRIRMCVEKTSPVLYNGGYCVVANNVFASLTMTYRRRRGHFIKLPSVIFYTNEKIQVSRKSMLRHYEHDVIM